MLRIKQGQNLPPLPKQKKRIKRMLLHQKLSNKESTWIYSQISLENMTHIDHGKPYNKSAPR